MIFWKNNSDYSYEQWIVNRLETIGASEVGVIVYGNAYASNLELFYSKIGAPTKPRVENIRMFLGKKTEPLNQMMYEYYEGSDQSIVDNHNAGKKIRETISRNETCFNTDYPHLSATPDLEVQPVLRNASRGKGFCEQKNTTSYYLNSFETGLPTDNVLQLCTQLMLGNDPNKAPEYNYGDLFYFVDNMRFELHEVEYSDIKNMEELILAHTIPFWESVKAARPLYNQLFEAQRNYNQRLVNELTAAITALEPPPQTSTGYLNFLSEKYKDKMAGGGIIEGTNAHLEIARKHKEIAKQVDEIEKQQRQIEIELKLILKDSHTLNFGKNGKITWAANKHGRRAFLNRVK